MTSSQPPQPPVGGQPPHGQQPPQPYGQPPAPGQQPAGQVPPQNPYSQPAGTGGPSVSFDAKRLTMASYVLAGLTVLYLVLSFFDWYQFEDDFFGGALDQNGWFNDDVKIAFFLFLLATVWAVLPAFAEVKVGFPRSWITVGLAAGGLLFTLLAWFDTFDEFLDFSFVALLGVITALAIVLFAVLSLLPELRNRPALPGALGGAAQWANRSASGPGQAGPTQGQQGPPPPPPPAPPAGV
jgi:hypothetical protein